MVTLKLCSDSSVSLLERKENLMKNSNYSESAIAGLILILLAVIASILCPQIKEPIFRFIMASVSLVCASTALVLFFKLTRK